MTQAKMTLEITVAKDVKVKLCLMEGYSRGIIEGQLSEANREFDSLSYSYSGLAFRKAQPDESLFIPYHTLVFWKVVS